MTALLETRDLAVARGGLRALEGVGFSLLPGQAVILRGPNGIGKTTLLRCLAGLQAPVAGEIHVPPDSLAYAGHQDGIKPALTVTENLRFWADIFGRDGIGAALERMNLVRLADRQAQMLSAGQKRRLGLARLLVTDRPLWLLDEPTVSLDRESVAIFAAMVEEHLARGGGAVIATHIDLGLSGGQVLDLAPFRARPGRREGRAAGFNEAFA